MCEALIASRPDDLKKNVAIVALSWRYLISNLNIDRQLLELLRKRGFLNVNEEETYERLLEKPNNSDFTNLLLSKMLDHVDALQTRNLILIDPFKLFLDVCLPLIIYYDIVFNLIIFLYSFLLI